jgi:ribosomal protein L11 methyltransferase
MHSIIRVNFCAKGHIRELLKGLVFLYSCSGVEEHDNGFYAYFSIIKDEELKEIISDLIIKAKRSLLEGVFTYEIEQIPLIDWAEDWKKYYKPIRVGKKITIRAPWHDEDSGRINILIVPSMAFGTGEHPTTQMCIAEIEKIATNRLPRSLLDIGTGSGILAIAASKLGFSDILALDIDLLALEKARENIILNGAKNIELSSQPLERLNKRFDVVVANLTAKIIKDNIDKILSTMAPNSVCILSGILKEQEVEIVKIIEEKQTQEGLCYIRVRNKKNWVTISFKKI